MSEIEKYISPRSFDEAVQVMADGNVTILCGGTDLAPQIESGQLQHKSTLMNIRRIDSLSEITLIDGKIRVGTLTTVSEIRQDKLLKDLVPVLLEAADQFASEQIRNAASIGGNICNASPAGDMIIPLMVLDSVVELASWADNKVQIHKIALKDFFTGPGKTAKHDNELLTAVIFDKPAAFFVAHFRKSGPRPALEIACASIGNRRY